MDCQCVSKLQRSENSQGARSFNFIDRNAQTGGKIGKSANQEMHKREEDLLNISVSYYHVRTTVAIYVIF